MQAIILAAGYGRRMRPLSDASHKALLPIGSTTILARIIDGLREIDIDDVTVVTGYRAVDIERYLCEHYPETRFQFIRNQRYEETNNIVSLSMGLEQMQLDGDLVLVECDLLFEPRLLRRLLRSDAGNIALVDHYQTGMDGTVVSVAGGIVRQVFPPHVQDAFPPMRAGLAWPRLEFPSKSESRVAGVRAAAATSALVRGDAVVGRGAFADVLPA